MSDYFFLKSPREKKTRLFDRFFWIKRKIFKSKNHKIDSFDFTNFGAWTFEKFSDILCHLYKNDDK